MSAAAPPAPPRPRSAHQTKPEPPGAQRVRSALAVAMVVCAFAAVLGEAYYRRYEAHIGGFLVQELLGAFVHIDPNRPDFYFKLGESVMGLRISYGCSTSILVFPVLLSSALCLRGRGNVGRVLLATGVAIAIVFITNCVRLLVIAQFVGNWGTLAGFGWGHTVVGSLVVLVGIVVAYFLYMRILFADQSGRKGRWESVSHR
ncbi:exosortase/archaeosortase family protein [Streptomyces sp. NBC_00237]|uniref:exosortase/archaeosortase family protein n=1 Tax=Streptomyces sp. NBC_00237 TaxID=2975687 RepID=UPI002257A055|nr:exosortase/archaeosortase family protein [Streptomyces sp. NBC_00237]MCX5201431.1 exosortase/archaeosortase family protein [Streptomyces sp. NBC_00237]